MRLASIASFVCKDICMEVLCERPSAREVVLTFGNFDGVHRGHMHIFSEVVRLAQEHNLASAALTFSPHTAVFLKKRENFLLSDFERKVQLIESCDIDYLHVVEFDELFAKMLPEAFIENILVQRCKARYVVVGEDCVFGYRCMGNIDTLRSYSQSYGYKVMVVDHLSISGKKICSSSSIRKCVESGDIQAANLLLGRCHAISGQVMRGKARGRTIGFPTLNLSLEHTIMPCRGVYNARVLIGQEWLSGIANIGVRPTFSEVELPILEMHIFDFDEDIYGRKVTVELIDFIRPEQKFHSIQQLVEQITRDIAVVKRQKH